jgi:putative ABC transport system permease protein
VMAYSAAQRTREIDIRMALGARRGNVFQLVLLRVVILFFIGLLMVLLSSLALTLSAVGALRSYAMDPPTFVVVSVLLAVVSLATAWFRPGVRYR